jgi:hypothetical protein
MFELKGESRGEMRVYNLSLSGSGHKGTTHVPTSSILKMRTGHYTQLVTTSHVIIAAAIITLPKKRNGLT